MRARGRRRKGRLDFGGVARQRRLGSRREEETKRMVETEVVSVAVEEGPSIDVAWSPGMNAHVAMERAAEAEPSGFGYTLSYYGSQHGYLVVAINGTFDTFPAPGSPSFYWEFLINGERAEVGIDRATLEPGDNVGFGYVPYRRDDHSGTLLEVKHTLASGRLEG
jgi:Domain of unknown function (DUF4430)